MGIRAKLFAIVFGLIFLLSGAASIYFINLAPVEKISGERQVLDNLEIAFRDLCYEINRLDTSTFITERVRFDASMDRVSKAFSELSKVTLLRRVDKSLAEALDIVGRLNELNQQNLKSVTSHYQTLYEDAEKVYVFPDSITPRRFLSQSLADPTREHQRQIALFNLSSFESAVNILTDSLESSVGVISEQGAIIDSRVGKIRVRAMLMSGIIIALVLIVVAIVAVIAANSIASNVIAIAAGVKGLREGDLSVQFKVKSKDEVGRLAGGMNEFVSALDESVRGIKDAASRNSQVRDELRVAAKNTGESLSELRLVAREVESQAKKLEERIGKTKTAVGSIAGGVSALDDRMSDQISMVEESTAAITQMLATIGNMARLAQKDKDLADGLVLVSDSGRDVLGATFEKIEAIVDRVGKIEEMIGIIDGIASQTNLLAMNAAIEAAHAGEAGKGFAVVADEIRKLAEASSEGSREIAGSVKSIVDSIASAKTGSVETSKAFGEIEQKIKEVSQSVAEISSSLAETDEGGRQILTAMTNLRDLSVSINEESARVAENSREIDSATGDLDLVADHMRQAVESIAAKTEGIAETADRTGILADELSNVGADLESRISRFKTTCEVDGQTIELGGECGDAIPLESAPEDSTIA